MLSGVSTLQCELDADTVQNRMQCDVFLLQCRFLASLAARACRVVCLHRCPVLCSSIECERMLSSVSLLQCILAAALLKPHAV